MYLSLKEKKTPKEHKILLLFSILIVFSSIYALLITYRDIKVSYVTQTKAKEKVLALVINQTPIKKEVPKKKTLKKTKYIKKEVIKEKPVEKEIVQEVREVREVQEKLVEKETVQEVQQETEQKVEPVFDDKAKESFIAGLYEILNKNKYYPKMAKRRKLEGKCEVSFILNKDGRLKNIILKEACGHSILDKAALKVVNSIEFYKPIPDSVSLTSLHLNIPIKYARN